MLLFIFENSKLQFTYKWIYYKNLELGSSFTEGWQSYGTMLRHLASNSVWILKIWIAKCWKPATKATCKNLKPHMTDGWINWYLQTLQKICDFWYQPQYIFSFKLLRNHFLFLFSLNLISNITIFSLLKLKIK